MSFSSSLLALAALTASALAAPAPAAAASGTSSAVPYAPIHTSCPSTPLVRVANGINSNEASYIQQRGPAASKALASWLQKYNTAYPSDNLPTVALANSGGGYRALLTGAGLIQAFDDREENPTPVAGLYQALTYQSGLSGGSWLLSSIAGNNWPTITQLRTGLWDQTFQHFLGDPMYDALPDYVDAVELFAKDAAGFHVTLTDAWGRFLSDQLLMGPEGGVADTMSGLAQLSNFTSYNAPFPIITTTISNPANGICIDPIFGPLMEISPYEFGSFDQGINAFVQTEYVGTSLNNGQPTDSNNCVANFDQLGLVLGTSSNLFNEACAVSPSLIPTVLNATGLGEIGTLVEYIHPLNQSDLFAEYPNPFYNLASASMVANETVLSLADGGLSDQNDPVRPFLYRDHVDVLLVSDNSADTGGHLPNGSELYTTYITAQADGLSRMPVIPTADTFVSEGLNGRPTFFGCKSPDTLTIIYLPNNPWTYPSGVSTTQLSYTQQETDGLIANGVAVANFNGTIDWPECLACGIMAKTTPLPSDCTACLNAYCYN